MRQIYWSLITRVLFFSSVTLVAYAAHSQVVINEFVAANSSGWRDYQGDHTDWIELYNTSSQEVDITNWHISDDESEPLKWELPSITLASGDYLVIFASGKDGFFSGEYHTNFKIKKAGETLVLSDSEGTTADNVGAVSLPDDVAYGRWPNGSDSWVLLATPSPGASNDGGSKFVVASSSVSSGVYAEPQLVELSTNEPQAAIRYTLNGSVPSATSPIYKTPIRIAKSTLAKDGIGFVPTTALEAPDWFPLYRFRWKNPGEVYTGAVLRYACFMGDSLVSQVYNKSIFVDSAFTTRFRLPSISLLTDSAGLFDYDTGIYVPGRRYDTSYSGWWPLGNYHYTGRDWERKVGVTYLNANGDVQWEEQAGVRVRGFGSAVMPQKSLNVYFRKEYGAASLSYPLFDTDNAPSYKRFILRNSGSDFVKTHFRDACLQRAARALDVEFQNASPVNVFINGTYWGIQNVREKYDDHYIANRYDVDPEDVSIVTACGIADVGDSSSYTALLDYIDTVDVSTELAYQHISEILDISNTIDYQILQIFYANYDWPCNNKKLWRTSEPNSKWRHMVYDLDASFGVDENALVTYNSLEHAVSSENDWPHCECSSRIFRNLLKNEKFKRQFLERFEYALQFVFDPRRMLNEIEYWKDLYLPDMQNHIDRWGYPASISEWEREIEVMRQFAINRPCEVKQHITDFFALEDFPFECIEPFYFEPDQSKTTFYIQTNPITNNEVVVMHAAFDKAAKYEIVNASGQVVQQGSITKVPLFIDVSRLQNGIYIIRIANEETVAVRKLLIARG